jgi:hypothetical protein
MNVPLERIVNATQIAPFTRLRETAAIAEGRE